MVQITTGTFGRYNGRKVIPITSVDGPQRLPPEVEARLVRLGVAVYVDESAVEQQIPDTEPDAVIEIDDEDELPELSAADPE